MNNIEEVIKNAVNKILNMRDNTYEVFGSFIVYFAIKDGGGVWQIMDADEKILGTLKAHYYYNDFQFTEDLLKILF